jgi:hypothetical protein
MDDATPSPTAVDLFFHQPRAHSPPLYARDRRAALTFLQDVARKEVSLAVLKIAATT